MLKIVNTETLKPKDLVKIDSTKDETFIVISINKEKVVLKSLNRTTTLKFTENRQLYKIIE